MIRRGFDKWRGCSGRAVDGVGEGKLMGPTVTETHGLAGRW